MNGLVINKIRIADVPVVAAVLEMRFMKRVVRKETEEEVGRTKPSSLKHGL